jgi:hypothetical protein
VWSSKGAPGGADTLKDLEVTDNFRDNENTNKSTHTRGGRGCREPQTWKSIVLMHISTGGSPSIVISPYPAPLLFLIYPPVTFGRK